jgi:hypothetical protein
MRLWKADTCGNIKSWIQESHKKAKEFVYSPEILAGQQPLVSYYLEAEKLARESAVVARDETRQAAEPPERKHT